jgi:thiopeptide-type bacteriocin biosynthesis protein
VTGPGGRAATVDRDGRRIEAVVAVVDVPDADERQRARDRASVIAAAGRVPPPRVQPAARGWRTFKLFGAEDRQDDLLLDAARPAVAGALAAGEVDRWFFQRYVDGPGRRPHLRLRVHATGDDGAGLGAFAARLDGALDGSRAAGAFVALETAAYFPERARFGGDDVLAAAERVFQSSSELACDLLEAARHAPDATEAPDRVDLLVMAFDALAGALGLPADERRALARRRRAALEALLSAPDAEERRALDTELRARARGLRAALGGAPPADLAGALERHRGRVAAAAAPLDAAARARLAPLLLHLDAVRLAGPHRALEARAYVFWERTLEGLLATRAAPTPARRPRLTGPR